jgi:hypothetical protein
MTFDQPLTHIPWGLMGNSTLKNNKGGIISAAPVDLLSVD